MRPKIIDEVVVFSDRSVAKFLGQLENSSWAATSRLNAFSDEFNSMGWSSAGDYWRGADLRRTLKGEGGWIAFDALTNSLLAGLIDTSMNQTGVSPHTQFLEGEKVYTLLRGPARLARDHRVADERSSK